MAYSSPAITHLARVDPAMRRLLREVGPCTLAPRPGGSPFESLVRAMAYQWLHDKAAESILKRLIALFPGRRFPTADILALPTPKVMLPYGGRWKPYRTVAFWYLWRAADGGKRKQAPRING